MAVIEHCLMNSNATCGVVAPTHQDLRKVVFNGDSGIINQIHPELLSAEGYNKSYNEITFYNGSKIFGFPAESGDRIRGSNLSFAWCDELGSFRDTVAFDNLLLALRQGKNPKCIITTTPRPTQLIKSLVERSDVEVIRGSTYENIDNLAKSSVEMFRETLEGTRLGRQELYGEILEDTEGALFKYSQIEENRIKVAPNLQRVVVAIDPAMTSTGDETGIVVAGRGSDNRFYILQDATMRSSPDQWIEKAISLYHTHNADRIIAEVNNGGDLIERLLRTRDVNVPYKSVRATRGKVTRAEPVSSFYERGMVSHVGIFKELESQMCSFTGNNVKSQHDDRVDALVWAITSLQSSGQAVYRIT